MVTDAPPRKKNRNLFTESDRVNTLGLPTDDRLRRIATAIETATEIGKTPGVLTLSREFLDTAADLPRSRKPPSQTWRTFLTNHLAQTAAIDFFAVPTATFRVLFVFVVLAHERRRVLHFGVTEHCPYRKCYPARMPLKSATLRG
jgi:hypothetical protein